MATHLVVFAMLACPISFWSLQASIPPLACTVPVPSGGFVRRVAHTPHYDGVRRGSKEPAVIGIFGQAPIELTLVDPSKPPVREV